MGGQRQRAMKSSFIGLIKGHYGVSLRSRVAGQSFLRVCDPKVEGAEEEENGGVYYTATFQSLYSSIKFCDKRRKCH